MNKYFKLSIIVGIGLHVGFVNPMQEIKKLNLDLIEACKKEDLKEVELLIKKGADVEARDINSDTPLLWACAKNHTRLARLLIDKEANINAKAKNSVTPLIGACYNSNNNLARLLIDKGADVKAKDKDGGTSLLFACYHSNNNLAILLVDKGADVNAKTKSGYTPLLIACKKSNKDLVEFLIDKGAEVNAKNAEGATPLLWACIVDNKDLAKFLIDKGADVHAKDIENNTPLNLVCDKNNNLVKLLIKKGADISCLEKSDTYRKKFANQFQKNSTLNICIEGLERALTGEHILSIKEEDLKLIDKLMLNPMTPIYAKQSALPKLLKYHRAFGKKIGKEKLLSYLRQIFFNYRFFEDEDFNNVIVFAIITNAKDKLKRTILVAAISCDTSKINKVISKLFEIKGDIYENSGLAKKWLKKYYYKESFINKLTNGLLKNSTDQEKTANNFIEVLTLAKNMNRKKAFRLLFNGSIASDYLKKIDLIKTSALKKVKREYLQELRKSEFVLKEKFDKVNKEKDRYIPSEVVANIMSFYAV